jgi:polyhydroxybutyrate depolymerase
VREPAPVVLVFHGGFGTGDGAATQTGFDAEAAKRGFVAAYPDGIGRSWNAGGCCGPAQRRQVDDVGFAARLLDELASRYRIDARRVYATGISNGGLMSYALACRLSSRIAAVAPVAATLLTPCAPSRPVSVLHVHGLADRNIPFGGGPGTKGVTGTDWPPVRVGVDRWRRVDGCPSRSRTTVGGGVTTTLWAPCHTGTAVQLVTIADGGHSWPGGVRMSRLLDPPSSAYDATSEIWRFFAARHR